jgi:hypothetical protein
MPRQRQREVEGFVSGMLLQCESISVIELADRAGINWFTARDVLRKLERDGQVIEVADGRFGRPVRSLIPRGRKSR